ncbi:DGQHR domain-containing protein DpdB [Occallatibacter savannae]|uniref:DGQHR domain-containing protein DpdB n=1 Tax=Occallatibacter savannae TaxID=1002691 RepID=UPI000D694668|nr:DGQHR domain-containing protein DpdB [Occallatibacter savannae]
MPKQKRYVTRRAIRLAQSAKHPLYMFALTGAEILQVADISRLSRADDGKLIGYQRPEVKKHIQDIVDYLETDAGLFPNSIILALSSRVKFRASRGPKVADGLADAGEIEIEIPRDGEQRPGWIVDGQQRALAISKSKRKEMMFPVNAFIADDVEIQRDQFLRVNNTKPLPRGLITELLPEVSSSLPSSLEARKIPSALCDLLNTQEDSPFKGLIIRTSTPAGERKSAVVTDTSIVKMLQESLTTPSGCLFPYRNIATGQSDTDLIWTIVLTYWKAVRNSFPDAWGKAPARSRLMHGAGIRSMGRVMDRVMPSIDVRDSKAVQRVEREIACLVPICHWTSGRWDGLGDIEWNEVQNVPRHIRVLSNFLVRAYVQKGRGA